MDQFALDIDRLIPTLMKYGKKLPRYALEVVQDWIAKRGLKETLKNLLKSIVSYVARESSSELAGYLLSAIESTSTKLAPKLAAACGTIIGGVGAVAGCLITIGRFARDIYKEYRQLKGTRNFKRKFGRCVLVKTVELIPACAGEIGSALLGAIVGFLIGGFIGTAVGFGVGMGITLAVLGIKKGLGWVTGKLYDKIVAPRKKKSIRY